MDVDIRWKQRFSNELAWKTMKDYLEEQGFDVKSPRSSIQTALLEALL